MAPIQMEKSYDVKVSSTPAAKCSRQARSSSRSWNVFLPISRRGSFFQDSFFSDIHKDFDSSVREVLARWSDEDLKVKDFRRDDIMDRYRQLRSRNLKEGNQAVTVTSDNTSHKIVLDVHDFMCGDVKVKVLDEEELLVEGHVEKKEEGSSSVSSHSFRRYFSLPQHTDMATIMSVMSADGILTITAPKIKTETTKENVINQTSASNYHEKVSETQKQMSSNDESEIDSEHSSSTRKETCSCNFGSKRTAASSRFHSGSWDTSLPITRRGGFFQDSFFSGTHREFDASIRKVLNGWNDADLHLKDCWDDDDFHRSDRLGRYRQLRSRNLWSDNQAVTVTSDNISYKILLDMHDFVGGDVKVKLMGEKELLVEAHSASSSLTFRRSFSLPESIDITSITSVMSSDGILTINASKKESETQQKTSVIPTSVKETHNASEVHSSTSFTTSGVSEEVASGRGMPYTAQEEERKYAQCSQENIDKDKIQTAAFNISSNTQQSSHSSVITDFASTRISDSLEAKKALVDTQEDSLPIARRGSFFQDSFFSDLRQGFDASVREILKKCNDSDLTVTDDVSHSDILSRYRQLRSRNMREEDQAFSVSSEGASLKIVMDVHDFMCGDVKVKVVDEKELVVEGRVEKEEGSSSVSSHSFRRHFPLPHRTDMTHIASVMSSDGILTITAPKTAGEPHQNNHFSMTEERMESTTAQDSIPEALSSMMEKNISVHENLVNVDQKDFECERKHTYENKMRKLKKECEFPAESKEVLKANICQNQSVDVCTTASVHEHGNDVNNQDHELKQLSETFKSTITEKTICDDSFSTYDEQQTSVQSVSELTEAMKLHEEILPITRRGSFVQDSFFLDVHQEFYTAIREVLRKWVIADSETTDSEDFLSLSHSDIMNRYRQLRSRDLREETQVSTATSDNTSYKIVLDVQDFMNGDLKVKVVDETKVVVEGRMARREEGSSSVSSCSFRRCFSLPEHIDMTTIMCILSSDGILTIIASKMAEESEEYKVISSNEEVRESPEVQRSEFPTNETISLHEECEKVSKTTLDCMNSVTGDTSIEFEDVKIPVSSEEMCHSVKSETAQQILLSTDSVPTSSHDTAFDFVESQNQSKETIGTLECAEAMADDSASVSDENQFYSESAQISEASLCRRSSISMNEMFENSSASRDFGPSQDSLPSAIHKQEKDSETVEVLHLDDSQQATENLDLQATQESVNVLHAKDSESVENLDLKDSQEFVDILDAKELQESANILEVKGTEAVEILDLTDFQESVGVLDAKDSEAVEILDLKDSQEFADILDVKDLHESADILEVKGTAVEILDLTDSQESIDILNAKDSEAVEILDLKNSQESLDILDVQDLNESSDILEVKGTAVEILDLTDSQESVDILDVKDSHESLYIPEVKSSAVEIPDLKDSQESNDLFYQKDSEEAAEVFDLKDSDIHILDLKDSKESVGILDVKNSQESVAEAQNTSEAQNSKFSTILDDVTEDAVSVQERSKTVSEEAIDSEMNQLAATESCTDSLQSSGDSCTYEKEAVDTLGQLKLKETTETVRTGEFTETVESLKGTRRVHRDSTDELLLITKRGNFFQDSFFLDAHRDFSVALRQVLDRCNEVNFKDDINLRYTDILERYRQLRSRDLKEEDQAVIVTSGKACLKIILDVYEFMSGDIQARVVDEKELVIEGRVAKSEGTSSETSHSFRRSFTLPQYTDITSVMSLDGILTVTVIFKEGNVKLKAAEHSIKTEAKCNITKETNDSQSPSLSAEKRVFEAKTENQDGLNKYVTLQSEESRNFSRDFVSGTEISKIASNFEDNNRLRRFGQECDRESQEANKYNVTEDTSSGTSSRFTSIYQSNSALKSFPVTRRGLFFSDYFFRDTREDFQKAVREVLSKWGEKSSHGDEMTCYRKLRARNMREDNQAVTSSDDEHHYKFVIDVQDFMDVGEISVKAVNERELVVEGRLEKKEDGSKSSKRFLRRFTAPGDIELEAVISVMSSDGVLKILAPKREVYNRKYVSTEVEDMDDGDATFSRKFTKGHCLADDILRKRDSSSDDEEFKAFARHVNDRYQVTFQDDDEDLDSENGYMLNKEAKMKTDKYNIPSFSAENRVLHIDRRGLFTEDYFFANVRHSYSQAVREVLEKANEWTCRSDAMDNYRRLRQRNLKLETQAVGILDDQDSHRIVMDIFDFIKGDVTVQLVKGKELLVEGQAEKQDGSRMSQVSFERRFALPDLVERDAISCVLSSDGILTITSKKRACGYRAMARGFSSERKSHGDTAGKWEDKKVKDSLADLEGPSSRAFCTGSRSHYHSSYAKHY